MKLLSESLPPFINMGLPVMVKTVLEKFGLPEPEDGAELLSAPAPVASPFGGSDHDDDDDREENTRKLLQWIEEEAKTTTNMRAFRRKLAERISNG